MGRPNYPKFIRNKQSNEYAVHPNYAKATLILYKPSWKGNECKTFLHDDKLATKLFEEFVNSKDCPLTTKARYQIGLKNISNTDFGVEYIDKYKPDHKLCASQEDIDYCDFLRTKAKGNYIIDDYSVKIDSTIKWDKLYCLVSFSFNSQFVHVNFFKISFNQYF